MLSQEDLDRRFHFHPPMTDARRDEHTDIRRSCYQLAIVVNEAVPDGREKSTAITKIEEAMFWANAALARSEDA